MFNMPVTNRLPTGGSSAKMNIFTQPTEPETKEGIWIQTNDTFDSIKTDNGVYLPNAWITNQADLPSDLPYNFYDGSAVVVCNDIYLFGGTASKTTANKYNPSTNTLTSLANVPVGFNYGAVVAIGTDIFLFFTGTSTPYARKYNTLNNAYTALASPYQVYNSSAVAVGAYIYLLGGNNTPDLYTYARRYNPSNNTYTAIANIPSSFYYGAAVVVGAYIYLFAGTSACRYNTLENIWTTLANIPYSFNHGSAVAIGTDIYLFGGSDYSTTGYKNARRYDTLTGLYSVIPALPYGLYEGCAVNIASKIYLLGGVSGAVQYRDVQVYSLTAKTYDENQLVITRSSEASGAQFTQLLSLPENFSSNYFGRFTTGFDSVYLYKNGTLNQYPTYYGTGSAWTQFITV